MRQVLVLLFFCTFVKNLEVMSTTSKKTTKKTALSGAVKTGKKLTTAEKDKLIKELSDNANRNMSFKLMVRLMANRKK